MLPAGVSHLDLAQVRDLDAARRAAVGNVTSLGSRRSPASRSPRLGRRDGKWLIRGLRDPLAVDPQVVLRESSIDPARVIARWESYQSLDPSFVLKRVQAAFDPPPTIIFTIDGDRIVAVGSASLAWIHRARAANRMVPAGAPQVDLSQVRDINEGELGKLREAIQSKEIRFDLNNHAARERTRGSSGSAGRGAEGAHRIVVDATDNYTREPDRTRRHHWPGAPQCSA